MEYKAWGHTDIGLKRSNNQDSILVDPDLMIYVVADGMGGHQGGEVASSMAVTAVKETVQLELSQDPQAEPSRILQLSFEAANQRIFNKSIEDSSLRGMGTTMVALFFVGDYLYIGNVGDSRAYMIQDPHLWQLTEDHSYVNEQIKSGMVENESQVMMAKNVITRSVGYEDNISVDIIKREIKSGEKFLLCSDGLSGLVTDKEIYKIYMQNKVNQVASQCIEAAKYAGGDDNISVIFIDVE